MVIEGGSNGLSTDNSIKIVRSFYKDAKIVETPTWSRSTPLKDFLQYAEGELIMRISADMLFSNSEALRTAIDSTEGKMYMCQLLDLWLDQSHIKSNGDDSATFRYVPIVSRKDIISQGLSVDDMAGEEQVYVAQAAVYHFGWLRPFKDQVDKHIVHMLAGNWGDIGNSIRKLGEQAMESWAVHHTMRYKQSRGITTFIPADIREEIKDMSYMQGFDKYTESYEKKYGGDFYAGLMSSVPPELIV